MVLPNVFNPKNKTLSEYRNEGSNIFIVWKIKNGIKNIHRLLIGKSEYFCWKYQY